MFGKKRLFGGSDTKCCGYCMLGHTCADNSTVLCSYCGAVSFGHKCRRYRYNPLKRIPRPPLSLPQFSAEDFRLE